MTNQASPPRRFRAADRLHIVLVPGFAGFDALGQLEYYAGVTPVFQQWKAGRGGCGNAVLHYFDNFPTAGVSTRAERLQRFLTKRIARGEFQPADSVALVGHSTGGLDIRRLLRNLIESSASAYSVDGTVKVTTEALLELIHRVVFVSVPQLGTNIAHWVRQNVLGRAVVVAKLRVAVAASQTPILKSVQDVLSGSAAAFLNLDLLRAVKDALHEAQPPDVGDPSAMAQAHEAAAQLELWLRHIAWDFAAIDDLTPPESRHDGHGDASPAHFTEATRHSELASWESHHIATRSYATVSRRPFDFEEGKPAPAWDLLNPCTWPEMTKRCNEAADTDLTYRYCYRACAGGPFDYPGDNIPLPKVWASGAPRPIQIWDNDGIVNSASMLWPAGAETIMVECDHEDIVGHFQRIGSHAGGKERQYRSYDLLGSASHFDNAAFEKLWSDIFDFCAGKAPFAERRVRQAAAATH